MSERRLKIVALGSSFAAGPGIEPVVDKTAKRSGRNYAYLLAMKLNADLTDLAVSGATLENLLDKPQIIGQVELGPQINHLPPDADIVTITAGGNDLGYSRGMIYDSLLACSVPTDALLTWDLGHPTTVVDEEELLQRFLRVIDRIYELAPQARIYLVEYLSVFGDASRSDHVIPLSSRRIQHYRSVEAVLLKAYANAARARPEVELVAVSRASCDHVVGSSEPWMYGFSISMLFKGLIPYHPNMAGHHAVADALYERIMDRTST